MLKSCYADGDGKAELNDASGERPEECIAGFCTMEESDERLELITMAHFQSALYHSLMAGSIFTTKKGLSSCHLSLHCRESGKCPFAMLNMQNK